MTMTSRQTRTPLRMATDLIEQAHSKLAMAEAHLLRGKNYAEAQTVAGSRSAILELATDLKAAANPATTAPATTTDAGAAQPATDA